MKFMTDHVNRRCDHHHTCDIVTGGDVMELDLPLSAPVRVSAFKLVLGLLSSLIILAPGMAI